MANKITRTVITHNITLGSIEGNTVKEVRTIEMANYPTYTEISKMAETYNVPNLIVMKDEPVEHKYAMSLDFFIANAVEVKSKNEEKE